jgi:hypothetical protein
VLGAIPRAFARNGAAIRPESASNLDDGQSLISAALSVHRSSMLVWWYVTATSVVAKNRHQRVPPVTVHRPGGVASTL